MPAAPTAAANTMVCPIVSRAGGRRYGGGSMWTAKAPLLWHPEIVTESLPGPAFRNPARMKQPTSCFAVGFLKRRYLNAFA